jgi:hypothetical protein
MIDPVIDMPDNGYLMPLRTTPGSILFHRAGMRQDDRAQALQTGGVPQLGETMLRDLRNSIGRTFYVDLLRMPTDLTNPRRRQGIDRDLLAAAPRKGNDERWRRCSRAARRKIMGPLIDRVFNIQWRKSKMMGFRAQFAVPAAAAGIVWLAAYGRVCQPHRHRAALQPAGQRAAVMQQQLALRQIDPNARSIWISRRSCGRPAQDENAPAGVIKSPERMAQERQQQLEIEQAQAQHLQAQGQAKTLKDGASGSRIWPQAGAGERTTTPEARPHDLRSYGFGFNPKCQNSVARAPRLVVPSQTPHLPGHSGAQAFHHPALLRAAQGRAQGRGSVDGPAQARAGSRCAGGAAAGLQVRFRKSRDRFRALHHAGISRIPAPAGQQGDHAQCAGRTEAGDMSLYEQAKAVLKIAKQRMQIASDYHTVYNMPEGERMILDLLRESGVLSVSHVSGDPGILGLQ